MEMIKTGIYETIYENACEYIEGNQFAFDLDMNERIPLYFVNFEKFIGEIEDEDE